MWLNMWKAKFVGMILVAVTGTGGIYLVKKTAAVKFETLKTAGVTKSETPEKQILGLTTNNETPVVEGSANSPTLTEGGTVAVDQALALTPTPTFTLTLTPIVSGPTSTNGTNSPNPTNGPAVTLVPIRTPTPTQTPTPTPKPALSSQTKLEIFEGDDVTINGVAVGDDDNDDDDEDIIVPVGAVVTTGGDTRAQLVYPNGSVTRLDYNTSVTVTSEPGDESEGSIFIDVGRTWERIRKLIGTNDPFHSDSTNTVATVRGTSYWHGVEMDENGQPVDKIVSIEGEVGLNCKKTHENGQPIKSGTVEKNHKAALNCLIPQDEEFVFEIEDLSKDDVAWIMFNIGKDEELSRKNPAVKYFDDLPLMPGVSAGGDQEVTMGKTTRLRGVVVDKNHKDKLELKWKPPMKWEWLEDSDLTPPHLDDHSDKNTAVTFFEAGEYKFRLNANDFYRHESDEVVITVLPPVNEAPTVDVGPNLSGYVGGEFRVGPEVSDDGLPANNLSYRWSIAPYKPGYPVKHDPLSKNNTFIFPTTGTYDLTLKVTDGLLESQDTLKITVLTPPDPTLVPDPHPGPHISNVELDEVVCDESTQLCTGQVTVNGANFTHVTSLEALKSGVAQGAIELGTANSDEIEGSFSGLVRGEKYDLRVNFANGTQVEKNNGIRL